MYEEFLQAVLIYVQALNDASRRIDEELAEKGVDLNLVPYVQEIPVKMGGIQVGIITDEIGGQYSYHPIEWNDEGAEVTVNAR